MEGEALNGVKPNPGGHESCVLMHFGMTGLLYREPRGSERHPHDRIVLHWGLMSQLITTRFGGS